MPCDRLPGLDLTGIERLILEIQRGVVARALVVDSPPVEEVVVAHLVSGVLDRHRARRTRRPRPRRGPGSRRPGGSAGTRPSWTCPRSPEPRRTLQSAGSGRGSPPWRTWFPPRCSTSMWPPQRRGSHLHHPARSSCPLRCRARRRRPPRRQSRCRHLCRRRDAASGFRRFAVPGDAVVLVVPCQGRAAGEAGLRLSGILPATPGTVLARSHHVPSHHRIRSLIDTIRYYVTALVCDMRLRGGPAPRLVGHRRLPFSWPLSYPDANRP